MKIFRRPNCFFALLVLSIVLPVVWASIAKSADEPLSRRVVSPTGDPAQLFLSRPAQAQLSASGTAGQDSIPANTTTDLLYHGGPVMRNPVNYLIFWDPAGGTTFPAGFQAGMQRFFEDIGATPFYNINTQYNDTSGVPVPNAASFGGSWTDTTAFPHAGTIADPLTDGDIQGAVTAAIAANPGWVGPGINTMYFVFTPPGVQQCFNATNCFAQPGDPNGKYCAYHTFFGGNRIYAVEPFVQDAGAACTGLATFPNGNAIDVQLSTVSHEMEEANTDPLLNAWFDSDGLSGENGDKCAYNYGYVAPDGTNIVLNGNPYQLQQNWSNNIVRGCVKRYGDAPQTAITGSLDFGSVPRGTSATRDLLIQNTAGGELNILNIRLGAGSSSAYSLVNVPPTTATIPAGESLTVQVKFAPSASASGAGPLTASVVVDTDDPAQTTYTVSATGLVGVPKITVPGSVAVGDTCVGTTNTAILNVCDTGSANLQVSSIGSSNGQFAVTPPSSGYPLTISPDFCFPFAVGFTPTSTGGKTTNLTIASNDPVSPSVVVPATGNGTQQHIAVTGSSAFGDVCAGSVTEKTIKVCNAGTGTCNLNVTSVGFSPACPDFTLVNNPFPANVSDDSCLDVTIRFTPTSAGPKSCNLVISSNDPGTPTINQTVTANTPAASIDVPPNLSFLPEVIQTAGVCTTAKPFPISNKGTCNLSITAVTIGGANGSDFSLSALPSLPNPLQPGHTLGDGALNAVFAPTAIDRDRLGTLSVTYVSDAISGATTTVTRALCGEGALTGARVLVRAGGVPLATVEKIQLQRINANRNKNQLDTNDVVQNATLQTVTPGGACTPFQFHREYGTVSNPIQLLAGSYQVTATAFVNGKRQHKTVGFDVDTCDFNPTVVVDF
jgi:hypothetical protein